MNSELITASVQLQEIKTAISSGNYDALQGLLLQQAVVLHKIGMDFIEQSCDQGPIRSKRAYCDLGFRALRQSQRTMLSIKMLEG